MLVQTAPIHAPSDTPLQDTDPEVKEITLTPEKRPLWTYSPMNRPGPRKWLTDERRQAVVSCRNFGMVPLAIADYLEFADSTVARYLREAVKLGELEPLPAWLSLHL